MSFLHFKDKEDIEGIIIMIINDFIVMGKKMILVTIMIVIIIAIITSVIK